MGQYEDQPSIIARLAEIFRRLSALERTQAPLPAGTILATGRTAAPSGYLPCDGQVVDQSTYAGLFAAIGTRFNTGGESASQFRLPAYNTENRYPRGAATPGGKSGAASHDHTMAHTHGFTTGAPNETQYPAEVPPSSVRAAMTIDHTHSGTTGGSSAANTGSASSLPPSQDAYYIIKA